MKIGVISAAIKLSRTRLMTITFIFQAAFIATEGERPFEFHELKSDLTYKAFKQKPNQAFPGLVIYLSFITCTGEGSIDNITLCFPLAREP